MIFSPSDGEKTVHEINRLQVEDGTVVKFCWLSNHVGVKGNEEADRAAVLAAARAGEFIAVNYQDWYPLIKKKIQATWREEWKGRN